MALRRRRERRRHQEVAEMNITAFMNLMVVLVPFLLITAVFSRVSILELNLPVASSEGETPPEEPALALEITVRESVIEVGDRNAGVLRRFEAKDGEHDLDALAEFLVDVKRRFPDKLDATLLLEPEIPYELIVAVMDRVRAAERYDENARRTVEVELFPEIAIGDATLAAAQR
ncbi:MAG: biopolymer transporter ExbD [Gammaproteobacteria bacterium]